VSRRRRERRDQRRQASPMESLVPPDIEEQITVLPQGSPRVYQMVHGLFFGRKHWTLLGFQSEPRVLAIIEDLAKFTRVEKFTWVLGRLGRETGAQEDALIIAFVEKTALTMAQLLKSMERHGAAKFQQLEPGRDVLFLSYGYSRALATTFDKILREGERKNN
jgi:hypothetical protein